MGNNILGFHSSHSIGYFNISTNEYIRGPNTEESLDEIVDLFSRVGFVFVAFASGSIAMYQELTDASEIYQYSLPNFGGKLLRCRPCVWQTTFGSLFDLELVAVYDNLGVVHVGISSKSKITFEIVGVRSIEHISTRNVCNVII